ncbi:PepSY-like domain-containing protein [uncultured Salegentibacter sp.]|uniref:PepSY-like domain-containing protein n=1 Tax=uncultured Salegentibacter sp. TaxID=259320 RepID=UPI0030DC5CBE
MKKIILGVGIVVVTTIAFTSVPQVVKEAFARKFPVVKKVDWEKENDTEWEAEFKINKVEYSANFLEDGTWQETEHEVKPNDVPQDILSSLKSNFPGYEIEEAEISETTEGIFYELEIEKGKDELEVMIDSKGQVLKQQSEKKSEENHD